jgi:2-oxo-4-hydroxy-4-carboxy-5-ureidoimidazoline decarboxylase
MNLTLQAWNTADADSAIVSLLSCCAAQRWAREVGLARPYSDEQALFVAADQVWTTMQEPDWMEAFRAHPRIGERKPVEATAQSQHWSGAEQADVHDAQAEILAALSEGNHRYEELFGFNYIVCATGKTAQEMLAILRGRLANDRHTELQEAAEQQRQITNIRLRKWLQV